MPKGISPPPLGTPKRCTLPGCKRPRTSGNHMVMIGGTMQPSCPTCYGLASTNEHSDQDPRVALG